MADLLEVAGHRCLVVGDDDPPIADVRAATDLVGEALGEDARAVVVPVGHLDPSFFELRTGFAGEVLQKAANYRLKFAVVGDVSEFAAASAAFHDLVVESRHSTGYFFVPNLEELAERLASIPA